VDKWTSGQVDKWTSEPVGRGQGVNLSRDCLVIVLYVSRYV